MKPQVNNPYIPDIDFPEFFIKTSEVEITPYGDSEVQLSWKYENKTLIIPTWFWEELVCYRIDVNNAEKDFDAIRNTLNK